MLNQERMPVLGQEEETADIEKEIIHDYMEASFTVAQRINEGKNAYILSLDHNLARETIGDGYSQIFDEEHRDNDDESAIKLLKVFKSGSASKEIANQLRAEDIINNSEVSDLVAVPEILNRENCSIHLNDSESIRKHLNLSRLPEDVQFIIMDMIDGIDLATLAYQHALIEAIDRYVEDGFDSTKKETIYSMIKHKLDYRSVASESESDYSTIDDKDERNRIMKIIQPALGALRGTNYDFLKFFDGLDDRDKSLIDGVCDIGSEVNLLRILEEDGDVDLSNYILNLRLTSLLEKVIVDLCEGEISDLAGSDSSIVADAGKKRINAFQKLIVQKVSGKGLVKPELFNALREAINLLHENGMYHCDLHERNVMISSDGEKLFIIDFDSASANDDDSLVKDTSIVGPSGLLSAMSK